MKKERKTKRSASKTLKAIALEGARIWKRAKLSEKWDLSPKNRESV